LLINLSKFLVDFVVYVHQQHWLKQQKLCIVFLVLALNLQDLKLLILFVHTIFLFFLIFFLYLLFLFKFCFLLKFFFCFFNCYFSCSYNSFISSEPLSICSCSV